MLFGFLNFLGKGRGVVGFLVVKLWVVNDERVVFVCG